MFTALDTYLWRLTYKWATLQPPEQAEAWVIARYFGKFNKSRQDRWVFGDRDSGAYLHKFAWTRIVRHQMVKGAASPDDPALAEYWAEPTAQSAAPADRHGQPAAARGPARPLPDLRGLLLHRRRPATEPARVGTMADRHPQDDHHDRHAREHGTPDETDTPSHTRRLPQPAAPTATAQHFCPPASLRACLSRMRGNAARPVLRGAGRSNAPGLPGDAVRLVRLLAAGELRFAFVPTRRG